MNELAQRHLVLSAHMKRLAHQSIFGFACGPYIKPMIGGMLPGQMDSQIVGGERGSASKVLVLIAVEGEDA